MKKDFAFRTKSGRPLALGLVLSALLGLMATAASAQDFYLSLVSECDPSGLSSNHADNLFAGNGYCNLHEFTPRDVQGTFATVLSSPTGVALDSTQNFFGSEKVSWDLYKITPSGALTALSKDLYPDYLVLIPVPEPSTAIMLGMGFATLLLVSRYRRS